MILDSFALKSYNGGICRLENQEIATKMAKIEHLCFVLEESGDDGFHNTLAINSAFLCQLSLTHFYLNSGSKIVDHLPDLNTGLAVSQGPCNSFL